MSQARTYMLTREIDQLERLNVEAMDNDSQVSWFIEINRLRGELRRIERWGTADILI